MQTVAVSSVFQRPFVTNGIHLVAHPQKPNVLFYFEFVDKLKQEGVLFGIANEEAQFLQQVTKISGNDLIVACFFNEPVEDGFLLILLLRSNWACVRHVAFDGTYTMIYDEIQIPRTSIFLQGKLYLFDWHSRLHSLDPKTKILQLETTIAEHQDLAFAKFDEDIILMYNQTALFYNVVTKAIEPFALPVALGPHSCKFVACTERMMVKFGPGSVLVLDTLTRIVRQFNCKLAAVTFAYQLPKANNCFKFIVSGINGMDLVSIPEYLVEHCVPKGVPPELFVQSSNGLVPIHKTIVAAHLPQALHDESLLNWSFASKEACEIVVEYLTTGDATITCNSPEIQDVILVCEKVGLKILEIFAQSLKNGTDRALNQTLFDIAHSNKEPNYESFSIEGLSDYVEAYKAVLKNELTPAMVSIKEAINKNQYCMQFHRLKQQIHLLKNEKSITLHQENIKLLVGNALVSDCVLIAGGETIQAHAYFLAQSPFIMEMLELKDSTALSIDLDPLIPGVNKKIIMNVLHFAYTNLPILDPKFSFDELKLLLLTASFFMFSELVAACEEAILPLVTKD